MISFAYIDSIGNIDFLVTNIQANQEEIKAINDKGIEVKLL